MSRRPSYVQDVAPEGGFPKVHYIADTKRKGFSNITLLAISVGLITYGLVKYSIAITKENELRLARVEEKTLYAKKLDAYLKEKHAQKIQGVYDLLQRDVETRKREIAKAAEGGD